MLVAGCPRCAEAVALHEGRPQVTASGVVLWHVVCWEQRHAPIASAVEPPPAAPRAAARGFRRRWLAALAAPASLLALHLARTGTATSEASAGVASVEIDEPEDTAPRFAIAGSDDAPPAPAATVEAPTDPDPAVATDPASPPPSLDDKFPTLADWVHPVLAASELYPRQESRHFGASRRGVQRPECGQGHCGVDLDGPRGRPIVAVAAGTLVRIERHELGLDGRSGRYVRIQHDDGTLTSYMHLDQVADGLHVGDRVLAGQMIGTLGATACFEAPAHLHFSLEVPTRSSERGDITDTRYVDPEPYLEHATVIDEPRGEVRPRHISS